RGNLKMPLRSEAPPNSTCRQRRGVNLHWQRNHGQLESANTNPPPMVGSKWHGKLSSVAVFLACALITWAIVVALAWLEERLSASLRTTPAAALVAQTAKASPPNAFLQRLQEQHFTGADCASAIAGVDAAELLAAIRTLPPDFWRTQLNAGIVIRQAA